MTNTYGSSPATARSAETVVSGLTFPAGMTVGPDGALYVSNQGVGFGTGQGQILRLQP